jgi:hypothetical protein
MHDDTSDTGRIDPAWVEHAVRFWDAETENATRIASRQLWIFTGIFALLGLGLYKIEWYTDVNAVPRVTLTWAVWIIKACLASSAGFFLVSLWVLSGGRGRMDRATTASRWLRLQDRDLESPATRIVLTRVHRAAVDLQDRNRAHWARLHDAQMWFTFGIALVFIAIIVYVLVAVPPWLA